MQDEYGHNALCPYDTLLDDSERNCLARHFVAKCNKMLGQTTKLA